MWDERYAGDEYLFGTEPNAFLKAQAHLLKPGQRALAVADGEGRNGVWLAEQGLDVVSMDASGVAIAKARKLAEARGVHPTFVQADIESWDWEAEAFDVVAAIFIQFTPPPLRDKCFAGFKKTLRPGGLLLLTGYGPKQLEYRTGGPGVLENLYTRALLEERFSDMDILLLDEHDSLVSEGKRHTGMSALVDLVARKRA
ncbi:class I SAM-dependent methyltransferase [Propylenella binzhouense]|uniref:Class I SAM-dependent methyltransferase n=1 Tax=Propylenella binzhouense TaxID=2555902 RepID=A0A964WSQ2_9HYPH|nr:class I SAM-dependent methyltransferase [Propylenella binzhouense]MYZ47121.1 class I SAM-dependent methyltransferase [Propylenella binzhouense]